MTAGDASDPPRAACAPLLTEADGVCASTLPTPELCHSRAVVSAKAAVACIEKNVFISCRITCEIFVSGQSGQTKPPAMFQTGRQRPVIAIGFLGNTGRIDVSSARLPPKRRKGNEPAPNP
jgi:hypothetical protein